MCCNTAELKIQMRFSVRFLFQKIVLLKPFAFFSSHVSPKADVFPTFFDMTEATGFCTSTQDDAKISPSANAFSRLALKSESSKTFFSAPSISCHIFILKLALKLSNSSEAWNLRVTLTQCSI